MQRLEQIPPEEMPQVVRIAAEMVENDRQLEAEADERLATIAAAKEAGVPEEVLERAAEEWLRRRHVAKTAPQLQSKAAAFTVLILAGLLALVLLIAGLRHGAGPPPPPMEAPRAITIPPPAEAPAPTPLPNSGR
jgi:hypothetical protein